MSLITSNLFENTLIAPVHNGADELFVVSGYATATMAMRHIEYLKRELKKEIAIRLIVGMCPQDGVQKSQHLGFQKLQNGEYGIDFECNYIVNRPPVHSKVYSWFQKGKPFLGYLGSANYTQNAFSGSMREVLEDSDSEECFKYYQSLIGESVSCLDDEIPNLVNVFERKAPELKEQTESETGEEIYTNLEKVTLTLLDKRTGEVPARSGLNWGQRPEYKREPNQAYLNIPSEIGRGG
jgi:hypothetical protein